MSHRAAAAEAFPDSVARLRATLAAHATLAPALGPAIDSLDWAMRLPSLAAPGFVYLAGARGGAPVGGGGLDLAQAAARLAGETSEALAQETPPAPCDLPGEPAIDAVWGAGPRFAAVNLTRDRPVGAPLSAVFPAHAGRDGAPPRSLGLAAGSDARAARLSGLLELVERDAAASWWTGRSRARSVCAAATAPAGAELARMRDGAERPWRPTTLLALASLTGLPVICAMSCDARGGGLAFGLKAALDAPAAIDGALCELLQMEIALEIAGLRKAQGRGTPGDAQVLRRAALDPDGHDAFAPLPAAGRAEPAAPDLEAVVDRLAGRGVEVVVADLAGLPGGLAVAKVFAPGLQPLPGPGARPDPRAPGAVADLM